MTSAVRTHLRSGLGTSAALVGVGVVTAAQLITPMNEAQTRVVESAVQLTAASGPACSGYTIDGCDIWAPQTYTPVALNPIKGNLRNIPANLLNAIFSIPRAYLDGLNDLSYGLEVTGSWWVYTPTNVLGFDPADEPKFAALANLLIPFKALSNPIGESITWWSKANLTMNEGCTGTAGPVCQDPGALLGTMFQIPITSLVSGFKYPFITDPVSPLEGSMGNPLPADYPGNIDRVVPWSEAYVEINPFDLEYSVMNYLTADPKTNRPAPITLGEVTQSLVRFAKALKLDFYPFVPMSFLLKGWPYTALTPLFKPFLPWLCPDCNPLNPAWPPGATEQPWPSAAVPVPAAAEAAAAEAPAAAPDSAAVAGAATPASDRLALSRASKRAQRSAPKVAAAVPAPAASVETPDETLDVNPGKAGVPLGTAPVDAAAVDGAAGAPADTPARARLAPRAPRTPASAGRADRGHTAKVRAAAGSRA